MKTLCFYFQIHQPLRLKRYRFFDMGKDHYYLDDVSNCTIMEALAQSCYEPMNALLLRLIKEHKGAFRVSLSISGVALEQLKVCAPQVVDGLKELAKTGCVEFLGETYSHSLASLFNQEEFKKQVKEHSKMIEREFGQKPTAFRNTELIYSDSIGEAVYKMGFKTMLAEGAKHILGWKSPNFVYSNAINPKLKLLLRNYKLSDDIAFRFYDRSWDAWPLTVDKYLDWITPEDVPGEVINIFMDYETFGGQQAAETGIFEFMEHLPKAALATKKIKFGTVSETAAAHKPVSTFSCPHAMSWTDEERDVSAWLGNELQTEAVNKINSLCDKVRKLNDADYNHVWNFMQSSDHFGYMATKWLSGGKVHKFINPYDSSYDAFINYMNVLSDFAIELDKGASEDTQAPTGAPVRPRTPN